MTVEMLWTPTDGAGPAGQLHATEFVNTLRAANGAGVLGTTVAVSVATMTITFPAFRALVPTGTGRLVFISHAGGTVVVSASDPTNPRTSIIQLNSSGTLSEKAGTATAETGDVVEAPMAAIDSDAIALLKVRVAAGATSLSDSVMKGRANDVSAQYGVLVKAANETVNNSNTLQNDDHFVLTVAADTDYLVEMSLLLAGNITANWAFAWTLVNMTWDGAFDGTLIPAGGTSPVTKQAIASASGTTVGIDTTTATSTTWMAKFVIHSGATGGTLNFQWAQGTADVSDTKVLKNSQMRYIALGAT